METRDRSILVWIVMAVLLITACFGTVLAAVGFAEWRLSTHLSISLAQIAGYTIAFVALPILAFVDVCSRRTAGRYLAVLSMMATWGLMLRVITALWSIPLPHGSVLFALFPTCGILVGFATLIARFAYSPSADRYFESKL